MFQKHILFQDVFKHFISTSSSFRFLSSLQIIFYRALGTLWISSKSKEQKLRWLKNPQVKLMLFHHKNSWQRAFGNLTQCIILAENFWGRAKDYYWYILGYPRSAYTLRAQNESAEAKALLNVTKCDGIETPISGRVKFLAELPMRSLFRHCDKRVTKFWNNVFLIHFSTASFRHCNDFIFSAYKKITM